MPGIVYRMFLDAQRPPLLSNNHQSCNNIIAFNEEWPRTINGAELILVHGPDSEKVNLQRASINRFYETRREKKMDLKRSKKENK